MTREILDLKNPKNRKVNNNHSISDILNDLPTESESEPELAETEKRLFKRRDNSDYFKEYEDIDPADRLFEENPTEVDNQEAIQNNAGDMAPLATLTSLSWTAPDKHQLVSHALRKWAIVILVVMAFVSFFWQESILTAVTFFFLAVVTSMHFWREARQENYEIHSHGVLAGDKFYHYHDLDSFWIHYHPEGYHELSLCTGKLLNHYIKVSLKGQDPFEVRDALLMYLPEKKHEEGLDDLLRRKLGL